MARGVEVAIIGGGVMGCGLAYCLAKRGLRVAIIERQHVAAEATGAAAGILSAQAEADAPGPFLDLALRSRGLYESWTAALKDETGREVGYARSGVLMVAHGDEAAGLRTRATWQQQLGLHAEWLDEAAVHAAEPGLGRCAGALRFADDGHVDPPQLAAALYQAAEQRGATLLHATVERIEQHGGRVRGLALAPHQPDVPTTLDADQVVLCAGSWSSAIAGCELPADAIQPVHGQIVELDASSTRLRHVVFGGGDRGLHGYLVPRKNSRILIGATMEQTGFEKRVTVAGVRDLLTLGSGLVPGLSAATFRTAWAGLRPSTSDGLPILGASRLPGLFICSGHFRNGILLAPISCEVMSALVASGPDRADFSDVFLAPFAPGRLDKKRT